MIVQAVIIKHIYTFHSYALLSFPFCITMIWSVNTNSKSVNVNLVQSLAIKLSLGV